jgi:hypothetical protein
MKLEVAVTMNAILDHSPRTRLLIGVRALALGAALVVIAYGITRYPESSLLSTTEARASDKPPMLLTLDSPDGDAIPAMPAPTVRFEATESNQAGQSLASPRECEPEHGVTDVCVFN